MKKVSLIFFLFISNFIFCQEKFNNEKEIENIKNYNIESISKKIDETATIFGTLLTPKSDFNKIISLVRKTKSTQADIDEAKSLVEYHVYDMFDTSSKDMKFVNRVKQAYWANNDFVKIVSTDWCENQDQLDEQYSSYMEQGYEGQMVRNDASYDNKRSKNLLKRKQFITEEFDVIQVLEGKGNWSGYAKRFILRDKAGKEFGSGVRGQQAQLKELWEMLNTTKGMPNWATCRYFELTPDGVPRFPVIIDYGHGIRQD